MKTRIKKVVLHHFRGATGASTIEFNTQKPIVLIFGENGSGKSSIIDGIDMVCNSNYGSIAFRSSTKPNQHLPAIGAKLGDVAIELSTGDKSWTATLGSKGVIVSEADRPPRVNILRRSQLLRLVETTPGERYKEFRQFLDVESVEASEATLIQAEKDAKSRLETALKLHSQALEYLKTSFESENHRQGDTADIEQWAADRVSSSVADLSTQKEALQTAVNRISTLRTRQVTTFTNLGRMA